MHAMHRPRIVSDWRLLFAPSRYGRYVNDHSLIRDAAGHWHLFGITSHAEQDMAEQERYFVHAQTASLAQPMQEVGKVCDTGMRAWAPCVIGHDGRYYMYYGPSPTRFATSDELGHWMENPIVLHGAPLDAAHRDHFVLEVAPGRWLMYTTGLSNRYGVISVFESHDLIHWTFIRYALRTLGQAPLNPPWGATESPFVVCLDGLYYLLVTYTDCRPDNYHNTLVFCSADPTDFGDYTGDNEDECVIAKLHAHAPEIVRDGDDQWYITTCGWRNKQTPVEGGVALARLAWD
jgi:arabinan endo-1,5-alpha-L-arabinosidase